MSLKTLLRGIAWSMLAVFIFSGWFVATRFSVTHELRVWDVLALRFGVGAVLLAPVLVAKRQRLRQRAGEGLLYAFLWGAPFVLLLTLGLQLTSAAQSSAVTPTLMPLFAGLIGYFVLKQALGWSKLLSYAVIIAGMAILVFLQPVKDLHANPWGFLPLTGAALIWAIYTVRFRRSDLSPLEAATLLCMWSAVIYMPLYVLLGLSRLELASASELLLQAFYQGVLMSVVAITSFNRAVTLIGPRAAAAIIAAVPVLSALLAIPFIGEIPTASGAIAIAMIAFGVVLGAWPPKRAATPAVAHEDAAAHTGR